MAKKTKGELGHWIIAEVAFFGLLYYIQYLLNVNANLWISSLIIWLLANISIIFCPVIRNCCK